VERRERAKPLTPDERRAAIIAATKPLLIESRGELTTRQVAEAAGVAEGTIFRVFPTKRDLLIAVAEETMRPPGAREDLERALAGLPDLSAKVRVVVERMARAGQEVLEVMIALRKTLMAEPHRDDHRPGPPAFIEEANAELLGQLTDVLFAPHADELRVTPARAAVTLRALVVGMTHPGLRHADPLGLDDLDELVEVALHGLCEGAA